MSFGQGSAHIEGTCGIQGFWLLQAGFGGRAGFASGSNEPDFHFVSNELHVVVVYVAAPAPAALPEAVLRTVEEPDQYTNGYVAAKTCNSILYLHFDWSRTFRVRLNRIFASAKADTWNL